MFVEEVEDPKKKKKRHKAEEVNVKQLSRRAIYGLDRDYFGVRQTGNTNPALLTLDSVAQELSKQALKPDTPVGLTLPLT